MTLTTKPAASHGSKRSAEDEEGEGGCSMTLRFRLAASCSSLRLSTAVSFRSFPPPPPRSALAEELVEPPPPPCASKALSSMFELPGRAAPPAPLAAAALAAGGAEALAEELIAKAMGASPSCRCNSVNSDSWNPPAASPSLTCCASSAACRCSSVSSALSISAAFFARSRASGELSSHCRYQPLGVLSILHWLVRPRYCTKLLRVTQMVEFMWVWCRLEMKSQ
mmetsp:Transcript_80752/g.195746  ORF Transcript_80752/g.195746 Transcript_80752/m.195746 type:complete len:224 (+) Transcript_80752:365-1036(+)